MTTQHADLDEVIFEGQTTISEPTYVYVNAEKKPVPNITSVERILIQEERKKKRRVNVPIQEDNTLIFVKTRDGYLPLSENRETTSLLIIDKNFNYVPNGTEKSALDDNRIKYSENEICNGLLVSDFSTTTVNIKDGNPSFFVIDKKRFIDSQGEEFIIKSKNNIEYYKILQVKKQYKRAFSSMRERADSLKSIIGSMFSEEDYDILFVMNSLTNIHGTNIDLEMIIVLKYNDIVIRNSYELSRDLGSYVVYLFAYSQYNSLYIKRKINAIKTKYSYSEISSQYTHSHAPRGAMNHPYLDNFCLGGSGGPFMGLSTTFKFGEMSVKCTDLEFEGLLFSIRDYLSWESLEGGPYRKIENISVLGHTSFEPNYTGIGLKTQGKLSTYNDISELALIMSNQEEIKNCFKLVSLKGRHYFICDYDKFFEKSSIILNENRERLNLSFDYIYDSSTKRILHTGLEIDFSRIERDMEELQSTTLPYYINGKSNIVEYKCEEDEEEVLKNVTRTISPWILTRLANIIVIKLNEKLKNNEY